MNGVPASDIGWFNYAVSYLRAAQALRTLQFNATHRDSPIEFLYYHSVELFLKAFLVLKGATEKDVKGLSHGIVRIMERCRAQGLVLDKTDRAVIALIDRSGNMFRARYIRTGYFEKASGAMLDRLTERLLSKIAGHFHREGRPLRPSERPAKRSRRRT